jgi:lysophospholipase L1-like esterase
MQGKILGCFMLAWGASLAGCALDLEIQNIEPGSSNIGDVIAIQGCGFGSQQGSSSVLFEFAQAAPVLSWSDSEILVTVPEGVPFGKVLITVNAVDTGGAGFYTSRFFVETAPILHRILAFGDSITAGVSTPYGGYTYFLEGTLDAEKGSTALINGGVGGETTSEGLARFEATLTKWNDIGVVLLMEGTNDVTDGSGEGSLASIVDHLRQMIRIARDDYAQEVVLGTILPRLDEEGDQESPTTHELVEAIRILAVEENVPLADHYENFLALEDWQGYFFDSLHPNGLGYQVLADSWYQGVLESLL